MLGGNTQIITVINKSGKVVNTSKHLVSVWKEARSAYRSRKAELKSSRHPKRAPHETRDVQVAMQQLSLSDEHLPSASHRRTRGSGSQSSKSVRRSKTGTRKHSRPNPQRAVTMDAASVVYSHPSEAPVGPYIHQNTMQRYTPPSSPRRRHSYDEHLAYGPVPPPDPKLTRNGETETQVHGMMSHLTHLLDEANCLQYSATATIEHLQKHPDTLAAVALTLAEISGLLAKLAPGALSSMKLAFPAVAALLMSPEFLIAGGLAVGVTVVMFGGYKIIQRIKNAAGKNPGNDMEMREMPMEVPAENAETELRQLEGDLSRIEIWRRGIADAQAAYLLDDAPSTIVEGEFATPHASRRLLEEGLLGPDQVVFPGSSGAHPYGKSKRRDEKLEKVREKVRSSRRAESVRSSAPSRRSRRGDEEDGGGGNSSSRRDKGKGKASSGGLRSLFSRRRSTLV